MAFGLMIAAGQLFAANLSTSGNGILAASPRRGIRVILISDHVFQSRLSTGTSLYRFRQPRTLAAIAGMTTFDATVSFHAATQLLAANFVTQERLRQFYGAVVSLRCLTAAASDVDALGAFGARRFVTDDGTRVTTTVEQPRAGRVALNRLVLTERKERWGEIFLASFFW